MLTAEETEEIERYQRYTLKTIYGQKVSYREALEKSGLTRLNIRREDLTLKFAQKCQKSDRFGAWFPPNFDKGYELRRNSLYLEEFTSRERMLRNPVFYMRKLLNDANNLLIDNSLIGLASIE